MFYQGPLQEGISLAVGQHKMVLCFVTNGNEESQIWENDYLQDSSLSDLISQQAVALRLTVGSEEARYLAQIFPLPQTPTVVMMKHGELKEYIAPKETRENFIRRVRAAFDAPQAQPVQQAHEPTATSTQVPHAVQIESASTQAPHAVQTESASTQAPQAVQTESTSTQAPHAVQTESTSTQAPQAVQTESASPPDNAPAPAERSADSVGQVLAERAARLQAAREEANQRAREQRAESQAKAQAEADSGADTHAARTVRHAEQLRQQRQRHLDERRRILKRIEDDREERRQRAVERDRLRIDNQCAADVASSLVKAPETMTSSTSRVGDVTSLQVRLSNGTTVRSRFKTLSPFSDVRKWVDQSRTDGRMPYTFRQVLTPLPNQAIDETEENKTLGDLGLAPSATLILIPVPNFSSAYEDGSQSVFSRLFGVFIRLFTWLVGIFGLGGNQPRQREAPAGNPEATPASTPKNRGIRGFNNPDDPSRDQQLYNGNSLNFEPRPDDEDEKQ